MKRPFGLMMACAVCALLLAGCAREAPYFSLDPAYADAWVADSFVCVRNGEVESFRVCAEYEGRLVALKYSQDTASVEYDVDCTPCKVNCGEFEAFAKKAIEQFGQSYKNEPYMLGVFGPMWDAIDPAQNLYQDFYVYDLNAGEFVFASDWTKGYEGYSGYAYLRGSDNAPGSSTTFFLCR